MSQVDFNEHDPVPPKGNELEKSGLLERTGFAHELSNLFQTISSAVTAVARNLTAQAHTDLERVIRSATTSLEDASALVRQTLISAMNGEGEREAVDVGSSIIDVARVILDTWPSEINVRLELEPQTPRVFCNPVALHNAILDLALRARAALPEGGVIVLAARTVRSDDSTQMVQISVSDTDNATTADPAGQRHGRSLTGKSNGFGELSTIRQFVKELGGTIDVENSPGAGTTVILKLPAAS